MPRSFLVKKKSDRESPADCFHAGPGCDAEDGGNKDTTLDQPCQPSQDLAALRNRKQEPEVEDATVIVPARRTTIWSPAAELHVGANKTPAVHVSPASGLTPFTPLSAAAAAAAAFLHPKGNYTCVGLYNFQMHFLDLQIYCLTTISILKHSFN